MNKIPNKILKHDKHILHLNCANFIKIEHGELQVNELQGHYLLSNEVAVQNQNVQLSLLISNFPDLNCFQESYAPINESKNSKLLQAMFKKICNKKNRRLLFAI